MPQDPYAKTGQDKRDLNASPSEVRAFHTRDDVDTDVSSHHHTLGGGRTQASPGNHKHDGKMGNKVAAGDGLVLTGAKGGNVALANLITMLQGYIEFTDSTT